MEPDADLMVDLAEQARVDAWMRETLVRYPHVFRHLRPCWREHTYALDALTVAADTWDDAYGPKGSSDQRAFWLDRWLPALGRALELALGQCGKNSHTADDVDLGRIDAS